MHGYKRRLSRFRENETGRILLLNLEHGLSEGFIPGLEDVLGLLSKAGQELVSGVILNKGWMHYHPLAVPGKQNLVLSLSSGTKHGLPHYSRAMVCSVQEALRHGADAVCVHINIGNDLEDRMLMDLGAVTDESRQAGLPVLATVGARGGQIVNEFDPSLVAHCIRLGVEMGADMIQVPHCRDTQVFSRAVASSPAPVLVSGGPRWTDFSAFLDMVRQSLECGAQGICVGRNVFQQEDPGQALDEVAQVVFGK